MDLRLTTALTITLSALVPENSSADALSALSKLGINVNKGSEKSEEKTVVVQNGADAEKVKKLKTKVQSLKAMIVRLKDQLAAGGGPIAIVDLKLEKESLKEIQDFAPEITAAVNTPGAPPLDPDKMRDILGRAIRSGSQKAILDLYQATVTAYFSGDNGMNIDGAMNVLNASGEITDALAKQEKELVEELAQPGEALQEKYLKDLQDNTVATFKKNPISILLTLKKDTFNIPIVKKNVIAFFPLIRQSEKSVLQALFNHLYQLKIDHTAIPPTNLSALMGDIFAILKDDGYAEAGLTDGDFDRLVAVKTNADSFREVLNNLPRASRALKDQLAPLTYAGGNAPVNLGPVLLVLDADPAAEPLKDAIMLAAIAGVDEQAAIAGANAYIQSLADAPALSNRRRATSVTASIQNHLAGGRLAVAAELRMTGLIANHLNGPAGPIGRDQMRDALLGFRLAGVAIALFDNPLANFAADAYAQSLVDNPAYTPIQHADAIWVTTNAERRRLAGLLMGPPPPPVALADVNSIKDIIVNGVGGVVVAVGGGHGGGHGGGAPVGGGHGGGAGVVSAVGVAIPHGDWDQFRLDIAATVAADRANVLLAIAADPAIQQIHDNLLALDAVNGRVDIADKAIEAAYAVLVAPPGTTKPRKRSRAVEIFTAPGVAAEMPVLMGVTGVIRGAGH